MIICENSKYLKSITVTTVTESDEVIFVMGNLSTIKTIPIATMMMIEWMAPLIFGTPSPKVWSNRALGGPALPGPPLPDSTTP